MDIRYEIQIVGGPFDGEGNLFWDDDGDHEAPELIRVAVCPGARVCGMARCRKGHTAYWTPDEDAPVRAVDYERQQLHVKRDEETGELTGAAIYAIGGLLDPQSFSTRELAGAGA